MTLFGHPVTRPLHASDWERPAGSFDFRVTSPFGLRSDGFHGALDIGNFRTGDDVVAARDGTVLQAGYLKEPWSQSTTRYPSGNYGGLMVVIAHAGGMVSIYAHLSSHSVKVGQNVTQGERIGAVGDTGSAAGAGHLHFGIQARQPIPGVAAHKTIYGIGLDVDPWPLITGTIPDTALPLEDDVKIPSGLKPVAQAVVGKGNRLRFDAASRDGSKILDKAYWVQVYGFGVTGEPYTLGTVSSDKYAWVGVFGETWFVAEPLLTDLTPSADLVKPADCSDAEARAQRAAESFHALQLQADGALAQIGAAVETARQQIKAKTL